METASSAIGSGRVKYRTSLLTRHVMLSVIALLACLALGGQSFAQILGTGNLNVERRGHTATLLEDGKILIFGGENAQGPIGQAEIFDPVSRTSVFAPGTAAPRTDHTATRLSDGRVLIGGGRNQVGQMDSTEIYSPLTGSFIAGPPMMRARSGHTATMFSNGKILIAGGDAMGSAELYDPASQSFTLVAGSMNKARTFHGAALLNNGQVLIAGGMDAQSAPLNTAELFDLQSQSFYQTINDMGMPRAFALMRVLPDGKVQIIGGDAEFSMEVFDPQDGLFNGVAPLPPNASLLAATLSTHSRAALISPEIVQDALLQSVLTPEHLAFLDRADHSITEIPQSNQALVAGGLKSSGQVLSSATLVKSSSATITTDKTDYAPGEFVTITGAGFLPNEQVEILFHEFPDEYPDIMFNVTANQQGSFITAEFAPQIIDIDRTFTLTAIGQLSGWSAQTVFTDGQPQNVTLNPTSRTISPGDTAQYEASVNMVGNSNACTVTMEVISGLPAEASPSFNNNPVNATNVNFTRTLTITTSAAISPGMYTFTVRATRGSNCQGAGSGPTTTGTLVVDTPAVAPTTLNVSPATGTYDGTVDLSATLTRTSDATAVSGKTLSFTLNGNSVGSAITNGSGVATLNNVSLSGINAGTYPAGVGASFAGDAGFGASNGTNSLTIEKANQTISFTTAPPASATFNTSFTVVATATSGLPVSYSADGVCTNAAGLYTMTSGTGTCTVKVDQAGNINYNPAPQLTQSVTAQKANQTINVTMAAPTDAFFNATFDVAATGGGSSNPVVITTSGGVCTVQSGGNDAATILMSSGMGNCIVHYNQAGNDNYNAALEITSNTNAKKLEQVITFAPLADKTFGDPPFVISAAGGASGNPVTFSSTTSGTCSVAGNTVTILNAGSCTIQASQAGNDNYNPAPNVDQSFTINRATPTVNVSGGPFTYDGNPHAATITATGVGGAAVAGTFTVTYTPPGNATVPVNAGTYAVDASFTSDDPNYNNEVGNGSITINKATPTVSVTGGTFTYNGAPHAATGFAYGVGGVGEVLAPPVSFSYAGVGSTTYGPTATAPVNAGTYQVTADFAGNDNYEGASSTADLTINKAATTTTVTVADATYNGTPHFATAKVTGPGALDQALTVNYIGINGTVYGPTTTAPTNAGNYRASASYTESDNYLGSSDTKDYTINKADPIVVATGNTCTYDGNPCAGTGTVTGVNSENLNPVTVAYKDASDNLLLSAPTNAGTYLVAARFAGNENYNQMQSAPATVTINKAPTTTTVTCPASVVYNGLAQEPCSAKVTGVGLNQYLTVSYLNNVNAGTATASASYPGDANHKDSSDTKYFTIEKAPSVTTVTFEPGPYVYRGTPFTATAAVTGVGGLNQPLAVVYSGDCTYVTVVNGCTATATYAGGTNHHGSSDSKSITILTAFAFNGFHAPIGGSVENDNGGSYANPLKTFKLASTIPVKFNAAWLNVGGALITGIHTLQAVKYSNAATVEGDPIDATPTDAATTGNQFRLTGTDWHFNLSTKGNGITAGTWLLNATLQDGSKHTVWIAIKK